MILRTLKIVFLFLLVIVIAFGSYFVATYPGAYKTCATITFVDDPPLLPRQNGNSFVDIRDVISKIPYQKTSTTVYVPKPELKYQQTIIDGQGNCSNMSFGLSYRLLRDGNDFQIVHLMPPNLFLKGMGHTVMNLPYQIDGENRYGIVDIHNAGLPSSNGEPITFEQLRSGKLAQPEILVLNSARVPRVTYYEGFLDDSALAVIEDTEVKDYFKFMDSIYFSLGNAKVEKYFFETLSIAFGKFPNLYVSNSDYDRLFAGSNKYVLYTALSLTWSIRVLIVLTPVIMVAGAWNRIRNFRNKRKAVVASEKSRPSKEDRKHKVASEKHLVAVAD